MKLNRITVVLGLALAVISVAQAQTDIYITGSTAFRAQVYAALGDMNLAVQQGRTSSANTFTFIGRAGDPLHIGFSADVIGVYYNVYCAFSGSVEGISALINPGNALYDLPGSPGAGQFVNDGVDFAFSDVLQSSTQLALQRAQRLVFLPADTVGGVAVQPFCIAGNAAAAAKISNLTSYNVLDVLDFGGLDLSLLTGVQTDAGTQVLGCGRYNLSGTRATTELDNADPYGINDTLLQYALATAQNVIPSGLLSTDGNAPAGTYWGQLVSMTLPDNVTPLDNTGTNGYFSGGNVGVALDYSSVNSTVDPTMSYVAPVIGYISFSDAQSKLASSTTHLLKDGNGVFTWNGQNPGVPGNWNITGVENGTYTFWSYEHLYTHPDEPEYITTTFANTLIQALQYAIVHTSPRTACLISEMNVYRGGDGGDVLENP